MSDKPKKKKSSLDDWMVRITFSESDYADKGFEETDAELDRKTKLALDKIKVIRHEQLGTSPDQGEQAPAASVAAQKGDDEKLQVMILDDEPIVGKRLTPALTKVGFDVEYFEDPSQGLKRLKEKQFDIVVTDFRMEEIDGMQVLDYIVSENMDTRVILITGYATVEVAREALTKGAFDFIAKPFKPKDLRAVVNKAALSLGHEGVM